jgi:hypothetical protein
MLALAVLLAIWIVLALLVPFMIASIRTSARHSSRELEALNDKIDRLLTSLYERGLLPAESAAATNDDVEQDDDIEPLQKPLPKPARFERRRKEPTL